MFASARELFKQAEENKVAIGAFNTNNLEVTQAIIAGAEKLRLPVIIQTTPSAIQYAGLDEIFALVKELINDTKIPATIHLDHATEINLVKECLEKGYRSVMFDGSKLPFEENVAVTKRVVDLAHRYDAFVEGEIGRIAKGEEGVDEGESNFTNPEEATKFAVLTGVNSLAISIGNVHGAPSNEKLDINLLRQIDRKVEVPLVLHGASGLSRSDLAAAIDNGIRKINIDTQIRKAFKESLQEHIDDPNKDLRDYLSDAKEDVEQVVERYLKIFNNIE